MKQYYLLLALGISSIASAQGKVVVSPKVDTLAVGSTVKLARTVTTVWTSSNTAVATVSSSGLVTAKGPGTATITVQIGGVSDQTTIVVPGTVAPPPDTTPPPPPDTTPAPPPSGSSNEPAGMTLISSRPFSALYTEGWDEPSNGGHGGKIISDASAPSSPPGVLQVTYPAGMTGGGAPWDGDSPAFLSRTVYIQTWLKISSNWQGHPGSGVNKIYYVYTSNDIPSFYIELHGTNSGPLKPSIGGQNIASGGQGFGDPQNPDWGANLAPTFTVTRGQWFNLEVLAVMNTAGNADGYIDLWINGTHTTHVANVKFQNNPPKWRSVHYAPVWGGGGSTVAQTMYMYWDNLYVSGK